MVLRGAVRQRRRARVIAFQAQDRGAVERFHEAALAAGGRDNGGPASAAPGYYAAYVLDPTGRTSRPFTTVAALRAVGRLPWD